MDGTTHADTAAFIAALTDDSTALTPAEFLGRVADFRQPGLYSWWVDADAAKDFGTALRQPFSEGLTYAGLAGATRWPSGRRSGNTLALRIGSMHLGGRRKLSTFRRSLWAILAEAGAVDVRGDAAAEEAALTAWMHQHLRVVAIPYADADTLGHLERDVLTAIDPPLNLQGMSRTSARIRLRELRRR